MVGRVIGLMREGASLFAACRQVGAYGDSVMLRCKADPALLAEVKGLQAQYLSPKGAAYGARHGRAKLSVEQLQEMKQLLFLRKQLWDGTGSAENTTEVQNANLSYQAIADRFGIGKSQVARIDRWDEWRWAGELEARYLAAQRGE